MGTCIVQALIYLHLLTITCLHNKATIVTKACFRSICPGVQLCGRSTTNIDNYVDYANG